MSEGFNMKKFTNDLYVKKIKRNLENLITIFGNGAVQKFINNINDGEYDEEDIKLVENRVSSFRNEKVGNMGESNLLRLIYMLKKKNISVNYLIFGDIDSLSEELKKELDLLDRLQNDAIYISAKKYLVKKGTKIDFFSSQTNNTVEEIIVMAIKFLIRKQFSIRMIEKDIHGDSETDEKYDLLYLIKKFFKNAELNDTEKEITKELINSMKDEEINDSLRNNPEKYKRKMLYYIIKNTNAPRKKGDEEISEIKYTVKSMAESITEKTGQKFSREKLSRKLNGKEKFEEEELNLIFELTNTKKAYMSYEEYPENIEHLLLQWEMLTNWYRSQKIDEKKVFSILEKFIEELTPQNLVRFYNIACDSYKNL